jgi:hypothetical protein
MDCDAKEHLFNTIWVSIQRASRPSCTENRESEALVFKSSHWCLAMLEPHISLIGDKRMGENGRFKAGGDARQYSRRLLGADSGQVGA